MANDVKWIITSSGRYMFVRFAVDSSSSIGFLAKIHYGNEILNQKFVQSYSYLLYVFINAQM